VADRLRAVRRELGDPLPEALEQLSDDELADLATAIVDAQRGQARALDDAIDHTLRYLPWPLSGLVKRVLVG
jgi:hypothetical protein